MAFSNLEYDLLTVLQSKLEASSAYDKYIKDCEQAGDQECRRLFEQIKQQDTQHAQDLRTQLVRVLGTASASMGAQTTQPSDWATRP
jgi:bacterioferritin (cytochrome b1)